MSQINWSEQLGWGQEHIEELRYIGFSYVRQGKYDIALPFFEALQVLDPSNLYDLQTLGAIHIQLNQPIKALPYFDRALKIESRHIPTLLNLTKAFFMLGKKAEGLHLANMLKSEKDPAISSMAKALIMAYE